MELPGSLTKSLTPTSLFRLKKPTPVQLRSGCFGVYTSLCYIFGLSLLGLTIYVQTINQLVNFVKRKYVENFFFFFSLV